jgi:hypothetical protein
MVARWENGGDFAVASACTNPHELQTNSIDGGSMTLNFTAAISQGFLQQGHSSCPVSSIDIVCPVRNKQIAPSQK